VVGEVEPYATLASMVNRHGSGRCAITLDPADKSRGQQPYQGVVDLRAGQGGDVGMQGSSDIGAASGVAAVLEHYMRQSEQLWTRFVLAADDEGAAGMLVQRLPLEGEGNLEGRARSSLAMAADDADRAFEHAALLAGTLTDGELLRTDVMTVLRRLYHEDDLRMFEPRRPSFNCRCSRERVRSMLQSLGQGEVVSVLHERGEVEIGCDFCGLRYRFDAVDVGEIFAPRVDQPPGSSAIN
jgi:molecular chaperone Hsp33